MFTLLCIQLSRSVCPTSEGARAPAVPIDFIRGRRAEMRPRARAESKPPAWADLATCFLSLV